VQKLNAIFLHGRSSCKELIQIYFIIFGAHLITQTIAKAFLFQLIKEKKN
jgi:hypothetical protein